MKRSENGLPWLAKKAEKLATEVKNGTAYICTSQTKAKNIDIKIPDEVKDDAASGGGVQKDGEEYMQDEAFAADAEPEESEPKERLNYLKVAKSNGGGANNPRIQQTVKNSQTQKIIRFSDIDRKKAAMAMSQIINQGDLGRNRLNMTIGTTTASGTVNQAGAQDFLNTSGATKSTLSWNKNNRNRSQSPHDASMISQNQGALRDYASNITVKYPDFRSLHNQTQSISRAKTPMYYNQVGPGDYNIPTQFGTKTFYSRYANPPVPKIANLSNTMPRRGAGTALQSPKRNKTGTMRIEDFSTPQKRVDILYPSLEQVKQKSPNTLFSKQERPEDVFRFGGVPQSDMPRPLMHQEPMPSYMRYRGAAVQNEQRPFQRDYQIQKITPGPGEYSRNNAVFTSLSKAQGNQIFARDARDMSAHKVFVPEIEQELMNRAGPGPGKYNDFKSFQSIIPTYKPSFPKASRETHLRSLQPGPGDYETDLGTWKRATSQVPQQPKCAIPKAYRKFDIIKCKTQENFSQPYRWFYKQRIDQQGHILND